MSWFKKALHSAGKVTRLPGKALTTVARPIDKLGKKTKNIPVLGKGIHAIYSSGISTPLNFAARVSRNPKVVHRAAYEHLKHNLRDIKEEAPYAQAVASFVPGVGTGISAGIGAGLALSKGKGLTGAMKAAVTGAIPGGPVIQGAYNAAADISAGKKLSQIQLDTLQRAGTPDAAQLSADIHGSLNGDVSAMQRVDAQLKHMPKKTQHAIQTGIAVGFGHKLQELHKKGILSTGSMQKVYSVGIEYIKKNPILQAGMRISEFKKGFPYGVGLMTFKLNPTVLEQVGKSWVHKDNELGFAAGVAAYIGMTSRKPLPGASVMQQLGYFITEGLRGGTNTKLKRQILAILAKNKETKSGAAAIVKEVHQETVKNGFWAKVVEWFKDTF